MGNTLMSLFVRLGLDTGPLTNGLPKTEKDVMNWKNRLAGGLSNIGGAVVLGGFMAVGAAASAMGAAIASSIQPASDLYETINKANVVFGIYANKVMSWGEKSAEALGMSKNSAIGAAATYGNLFRALGITENKAADMSISLIKLAADLASFNNISPDEALEKLRAGLVGETMPMRTLGININEAMLKAKAFSMGMGDGKETLDATARTLASYALIMEQTGLAQGDFARTSEGLANQQRIMKAQVENLKAAFGSSLLPAVNKVVGIITTWLGSPEMKAGIAKFSETITKGADKLSELAKIISETGVKSRTFLKFLKSLGVPQAALDTIQWLYTAFDNLTAAMQKDKGILVGVFAALGVAVLAWAATTAVAVWTALAPLLPVIAVMVAIGAVAYLVYTAWTQNWGGIQQVVGNAIASIVGWWNGTLLPALANVQAFMGTVITAIVGWWQGTLLPALTAVWNWMSTVLFPFFQAFGAYVGAVFNLAFTVLAGIWQNVLYPGIVALTDYLMKTTGPAFTVIGEFLNGTFIPIVQLAAKWIGEELKRAFETLNKIIILVTATLDYLAKMLRNMKLPKWMTPGSPTPWEIGLVGVAEAMKTLNKESLPAFAANMKLVSAVEPASLNPRVAGVSSSGNSRVEEILTQILNKQFINERMLSIAVTDAVAKAVK